MTQIDSDGDAKAMAKQLKETKNADFETLFKRWEQASQMRRWTQQVKLQLRESIEAEEIKILREEINTAHPDSPPFTEPLNEEQRETVEKSAEEKFDSALAAKYEQVNKKSLFLIKLEVPLAFRQARKTAKQAELQKKISNTILTQFETQQKIIEDQ